MKKQRLQFILGVILTVFSCKTQFLQKEIIASYDIPNTRQNQVIYFHKHFELCANGNIQITSHSLLKVGQNLTQLPNLLGVHDGSIEKLKAFQARILHTNGKEQKFSKGDLTKVDLSNASVIQESFLYLLPIKDDIQCGDIIEKISVHENTLPFLGEKFSPIDVSDNALNITCSFQVNGNEQLEFWVKNDTIQPQITDTLNTRLYTFTWEVYEAPNERTTFAKRNQAPRVFARFNKSGAEQSAISTWQSFGDTYLDLIQSQIQIEPAKALATELTQGKSTPKEKMDAIAAYCQENIRYEQVYLTHGEFIPHAYPSIIAHKYGDCKDYSMAIYSLARSIGLEPDLVLCHRGRVHEIYPEIPVSQFDHMIVHFADGGQDYWYDGTNRTGQPGLVSADLVNQSALILTPGNSKILQISERTDDRMEIQGNLRLEKKNLKGDLTVTFYAQDAIHFLSFELFNNQAKMKTSLYKWFQDNLNENIQISELHWLPGKDFFKIEAKCEIPNSAIIIESSIYLSLSRIFDRLLLPDSDLTEDELYYYPGYNRVAMEIYLENLSRMDEASPIGYVWHENINLPAGPFSPNEKSDFIRKFKELTEKFNQKVKFELKERS